MARPVADLYDRVRHLVPELVKFGVVGGIGTIVDLGGAAVLHGRYHQGPLTAKGISITVAAIITYLGSRFWTFRHRENQPLLREGMLFLALNVVGLLMAEAVIALITYVLGFRDPIAYNIASLAGTGAGTIFRFYAYRKWVFTAPAAPSAPTAEPEYAAYSPWEPMSWQQAQAPAYSMQSVQQPRQVRLQNSVIPNGPMAPPLVTAAASAWQPAPTWDPAPTRTWEPAPAQAWEPAPAQAWEPAPARQPAPAWDPAPARAWEPAPAQEWDPVPARQPAPPPDARPAAPRSPGRHRKR